MPAPRRSFGVLGLAPLGLVFIRNNWRDREGACEWVARALYCGQVRLVHAGSEICVQTCEISVARTSH
jgi:hypothetical protein